MFNPCSLEQDNKLTLFWCGHMSRPLRQLGELQGVFSLVKKHPGQTDNSYQCAGALSRPDNTIRTESPSRFCFSACWEGYNTWQLSSAGFLLVSMLTQPLFVSWGKKRLPRDAASPCALAPSVPRHKVSSYSCLFLTHFTTVYVPSRANAFTVSYEYFVVLPQLQS